MRPEAASGYRRFLRFAAFFFVVFFLALAFFFFAICRIRLMGI